MDECYYVRVYTLVRLKFQKNGSVYGFFAENVINLKERSGLENSNFNR